MTVSPPTPEPPQTLAPTPRMPWATKAAIGTGAILLVLVVVLFVVPILTRYRLGATAACTAAQQSVTAAFKVPATAKFQNCYDEAVKAPDGTWTVTVAVDGQNIFGAPQRTRYRVSGLRFLGRDAKGKDLWRRENPIVDLGP